MKRKAKPLPSDKIIQWIEGNLFIPEGKLVGKPFVLTDPQKDWIRDMFDTPCRRFILSMARKQGKTSIIAALLCCFLLGPLHRRNGQVIGAAQSRQQAGIMFELAEKMIRFNEKLLKFCHIVPSQKTINVPELGNHFRAIAADAGTAQGLSPYAFIFDEIGQTTGPQNQLAEALLTAQSAHEKPLGIFISTQAPSDNSFLSLLIDEGLTGADPEIKVRLYTAPMDIDPFSEAAIRAASPHFDHPMFNKRDVMKQAKEASRMPSRENSYRNLILNQRIEARVPFVSRTVWEENREPISSDWSDLPVYAGLDLSSVSDLTAIALICKVDEKWEVRIECWLPKEGILDKSRHDKVPYDVWHKQGLLHLTPGRTIDYKHVGARIRELFDLYNIQSIGFDRWGMQTLKGILFDLGMDESFFDEKFQPHGQGFKDMSPPIKEFERLLLEKNIRHGNNPILNWNASNLNIESDPAGNRKFVKDNKNSARRIDAVLALVMAIHMSLLSSTNQNKKKVVQRTVSDYRELMAI